MAAQIGGRKVDQMGDGSATPGAGPSASGDDDAPTIAQRTRAGCGVDVTGRIATNGAAGTVSYQWLFQPGLGPPQPLSQSVIAGQKTAFVTVAVEGSGHGRASQTVTLQVLGPDPMNASTAVVVSC